MHKCRELVVNEDLKSRERVTVTTNGPYRMERELTMSLIGSTKLLKTLTVNIS
jgi:hypothetical protein